MATEPDGVEAEMVDVPAGLWVRPGGASTAGPVILAVAYG